MAILTSNNIDCRAKKITKDRGTLHKSITRKTLQFKCEHKKTTDPIIKIRKGKSNRAERRNRQNHSYGWEHPPLIN